MTSYLSWQTWVMIGMAIVIVACLDHMTRLRIRRARDILASLREAERHAGRVRK
jgi:hypothetical protein